MAAPGELIGLHFHNNQQMCDKATLFVFVMCSVEGSASFWGIFSNYFLALGYKTVFPDGSV